MIAHLLAQTSSRPRRSATPQRSSCSRGRSACTAHAVRGRGCLARYIAQVVLFGRVDTSRTGREGGQGAARVQHRPPRAACERRHCAQRHVQHGACINDGHMVLHDEQQVPSVVHKASQRTGAAKSSNIVVIYNPRNGKVAISPRLV